LSTHELKNFGEKLRALRTRDAMTLKRLSEALGMETHSYLSELESGKKLPSALLVVQIARHFRVTTDELLLDDISLNERRRPE
jgi:transcriptional regulator with XRE-family HTH domain